MTLALPLFLDPLALRLRACCVRLSFFSARRRKRGASIFVPSERTAKCPKPRSIPTTCPVSGSVSGPVSTTNEAKYLPAASLITVTVDGTEGRLRDHLTRTSPIFGRDRSPPVVTFQRALAVNRTACRLSLRLLNRGAPMRGRLPLRPSKKFR